MQTSPPIRRRTMKANGADAQAAPAAVPSQQFVPEGVERTPLAAAPAEPPSALAPSAPPPATVRVQAAAEVARLDSQAGVPQPTGRKGNRFGPAGLSSEMRKQISDLIAAGKSVTEVSKALSVSYLTVKKYATAAGAAPAKRTRKAAPGQAKSAKPAAQAQAPAKRVRKAAPAADLPANLNRVGIVVALLRDKKLDVASALQLASAEDLIGALL